VTASTRRLTETGEAPEVHAAGQSADGRLLPRDPGRLASIGVRTRHPPGEPGLDAVTTCRACGEPMIMIEAGQTTHPCCDPRAPAR
jgi:hypothetical protein